MRAHMRTQQRTQQRTQVRAPRRADRPAARGFTLFGVLGVLSGLVGATSGCKDLTAAPPLPSNTPNPAYYNTYIGAIGLRDAAILRFENAWISYMWDSGALTDELEDNNAGRLTPGVLVQLHGSVTDPLDERLVPIGSTVGGPTYGLLQETRGDLNNALGALAAYDTAASAPVLRGELYALEGYAEIMLADLYCSGVPLSTLDFQKDFTYKPSSTSDQVYQDAIAKLDSALLLGHASDTVVNLARVGLGRAYLDRGANYYGAAADDVAQVPTTFAYDLFGFIYSLPFSGYTILSVPYALSDREGRNGLPFVSSQDPRSAVGLDTANLSTQGGAILDTVLYALKYDPSGTVAADFYSQFTVADGIEARLIQAEAQLKSDPASGAWIATLNALRATVPGLSPIADPGNGTLQAQQAQVDTLLTERAEWLWLTGHRQGDLRRALRQYSQYPKYKSQQLVYPNGAYSAGGTGFYGTSVVVPVPSTEDPNPFFHGCLSYAP